jgi:hypothetical protein
MQLSYYIVIITNYFLNKDVKKDYELFTMDNCCFNRIFFNQYLHWLQWLGLVELEVYV